MTIAKIRVKVGAIELEYEGESQFLEKSLLEMARELHKLAPAVVGNTEDSSQSKTAQRNSNSGQSLTTKSIATKFSAKSGSDLAEAAVAHLAIIKGMATFKRSDINDAMRSAAGIYKTNMTKNLSSIIQALLGQDTLVETGTDTYAITPGAEARLKGQLGIG